MKRFVLILILIIAFFLRVYKITSIPPSLNWDEVSIGFNAYSILKTGKDEWRQFMPLHFKSYGEYKLPGQIYASIPAIAIFGLNPFGVRITPVIYGTLTVLVLYFLVLELFKVNKSKYSLALISAFLLAISPWHIQLTRASFESSFSLLWVILGILFMLKGLEKPQFWILSVISYVISIYTYNSARVFAPLFLGVSFLILFKQFKSWKWLISCIILFILLLLPLFPFIVSGEASARYKLVSITDDPGLVPRIERIRNESKLPSIINRLVNNRITYVSYYFTKNYLAHFTPNFLFINGASHYQHHPQGMGELYWIQAPFIFLGLWFLFRKRNYVSWLLLFWLLLAFVPVATTNDSIPNALRTIIANPVYQILTAVGFVLSLNVMKNKKIYYYVLCSMFYVLLFSQFVLYYFNYLLFYSSKHSRDWQYGNKEAVEYVKENYNKYDMIVYTRAYGEPHMFTLFYLNWDPSKYQSDPNLIRFASHDWVWVTNFDKFYFPNLSDKGTQYQDILNKYPNKKILFIGKDSDFPKEIELLETIKFLDGSVAFKIINKI